ncbi:MAG TPA: hypothetical protein VKV74_12865 [Bryobacteraceae bacterium]|nr:hypothetical protein [Bryobacteraceae bacterium]
MKTASSSVDKLSPGCKYCYMYGEKRRYGQEPNLRVRQFPEARSA